MTLKSGCQPHRWPANRVCRSPERTKRAFILSVAAVLAFLCALGTSLQAQTASFSGSTTVFDSSHFVAAEGITTDAKGDLFIAATPDHSTWNVYEMQRTGSGVYGAPVALPAPAGGYGCSGISYCLRNVAVDPAGNLWVAAWGTGKVYKVPYNSATSSYTTASLVSGPSSGWKKPWGIASDAAGNIFVGDETANSIAKIAGGTATWINTTSAQQPGGLVVDSGGNLLVLDGNVARVVMLTASSSYASGNTVGSANFGGPGNLTVDANGNIWVTNYNANLVCEMTIASNFATTLNFGSGLQTPVELWPTFEGNILVSDEDHGVIRQIAPVVNVGTVAIGSTSTRQTLTFTFTGSSSTAIQAPVVVTQGATGLDFADAGTGSCSTTNGASHPYASNATCTVDVTVKPKYAGTRYGAVKLLSTSGALLATAYLYGTGVGPQLVFAGGF